MEKINLEEMFYNNFDCYTQSVVGFATIETPSISKEKFKELCLSFGKELLELSSKRVEEAIEKSEEEIYIGLAQEINNSILETINQVE